MFSITMREIKAMSPVQGRGELQTINALAQEPHSH